MDEFQLNFVVEVMPVVRAAARRAYPKGTPNRRDKIDNVLSYGWQFSVAARGNPRATPRSIAHYAVKRAKSPRGFAIKVRDIEFRGLDQPRPTRVEFDVSLTFRVGDDSAEIAALRIDFRRWLKRLPVKKRKVCRALLAGFTTAETAKLVGFTSGRVSQIRRELADSWEAFHA